MKDLFKKALPYLISTLIGLIICLLIANGQDIWNKSHSARQTMQILSDAFFASGAVLGGIGLLVVVSNGGFFNIFGYAVIRLFDLVRKDCRNKKYRDFYEYSQAKKGENRSVAFLLIVGIVFIAISVVFLIIYINI